MEKKHSTEKETLRGEIQRFINQNRLSQRVKYSPAIVSNAQVLKKRREENRIRAKQELRQNEKSWDTQKMQIQLNVAHRPLLVEQVSKAFIHNLKQIRDLQRYVKILQEAGIDPNEYLSQDQKELLTSAEYYDKLNHEKAFLPRIGDTTQ